jgi:hypothetical protein
VDGHSFASKAEARRYGELRLLEHAGQITGLSLQPRYPILIDRKLICTYVADFAYVDSRGVNIVEDVKSTPTRTPIYRLKLKLLRAVLSITVTEIG